MAVETGLLGLAGWQYQRMQHKQQLAAQLANRQPVMVSGTWQANAGVVLDNQPHPQQEGVVGWRLLTPLHTASGTVVVDRGWLPLPADRTAPPALDNPLPATAQVVGIWADYPQRHGWLGGPDTTTHPRILAWLNPALITSDSVGPQYMQAMTSTAAGVLARPPAPPTGQRHAAYALQWLLMALAFPLLCLAAFRRKNEVANKA